MKTTSLLIGFFLWLACYNTYAQITFQKTYGGVDVERGYSVQQTADSGYIIAGYTQSYGAGIANVYLIKTDLVGDTVWTKTYGGSGNDRSRFVQQTVDGGYIITGRTSSFGVGSYDVYLIKTNSVGDTLWTKTYGGSGNDRGYFVQQTVDGGYIIAGYTGSFGAGNFDVYLIKTNSLGDTLWTKTYGGIDNDRGYSVQQTTDSGYIIAGYTESFGAGSYDVYLIKTNSLGDTLWTKTYGGISVDKGWPVRQTLDGGYIIVGTTFSFGAGNEDVYLIKTNSVGDTLWTKVYGGTNRDLIYSVQQTLDGGFIIAGETMSFGAGNWDVYLIKTNSLGDTLWVKTYGGINGDGGTSVQQTLDGGYIVAGVTENFGAGDYDVYLIKTDANGNSGCNQMSPNTIVSNTATIVGSGIGVIGSGAVVGNPATIVGSTATIDNTLCLVIGLSENEKRQNQVSVEIYPNPFSSSAVIELAGGIGNKEYTFVMYDVLGREVRELKVESLKFKVERGNLRNGMYFYKVTTDNGIIGMGKLVIE